MVGDIGHIAILDILPDISLIDDPEIVIKEDSEYPSWVFELHKPVI